MRDFGGLNLTNKHVRTALLFKRLAFKTQWIEYPDIEPELKRLGAEPTGKWTDGGIKYTLPVIYDDSTGKFVSDSMTIAEYLEDTYPNTPSLFPFGARAPIHMFVTMFSGSGSMAFRMVTIQATFHILNPSSAEYFRRTREELFGKTLEELAPEAEKGALFNAGKEDLSKIAAILSTNGHGLPYFYGTTISYADLVILSYLLYAKAVLGQGFKAIEEWDDGRWGRLLDATTEYQVLEV